MPVKKNDPEVTKALEDAKEEGQFDGMAHAFNLVLDLLDGKNSTSAVAGLVDAKYQRIRSRIAQLLGQ